MRNIPRVLLLEDDDQMARLCLRLVQWTDVVITGNPTDDNQRCAAALGVACFLAKPFAGREFRNAVADALHVAPQSQALEA